MGFKLIPLTQGASATVDADDYEWVARHKWYLNAAGYAVRSIGKGGCQKEYMHRAIAGTPQRMCTDHINGNRLDNRKSNLRHATYGQNNINGPCHRRNSIGYRGVTWSKKAGAWRAKIVVAQKPIYLGSYATPEAAAMAFNKAAVKHFGDFAQLNPV